MLPNQSFSGVVVFLWYNSNFLLGLDHFYHSAVILPLAVAEYKQESHYYSCHFGTTCILAYNFLSCNPNSCHLKLFNILQMNLLKFCLLQNMILHWWHNSCYFNKKNKLVCVSIFAFMWWMFKQCLKKRIKLLFDFMTLLFFLCGGLL